MKNTAPYLNALATNKAEVKQANYSVAICRMKLAMTAAKAEVKRLKGQAN
jgi:hypothetical protein